MKNTDNECFRWCHVRHINPQGNHPERIKKGDQAVALGLSYNGITFPVSIRDYNKVEKQNDININVFGYENWQPYPIYVTEENNKDVLNLLLIANDFVQHYVYIKDFNRFMYNQSKHEHKKHFCMRYLQCFSSNKVLGRHKEVCIVTNGKQAVRIPGKYSVIRYRNFHKQLDVPFVIYADLEAILEGVSGNVLDDGESYTNKYQKHTDCGYGYKLVCCYDDKYSKPVEVYRGKDAVRKFMHRMLEEVKYCNKVHREHFSQDMLMTTADKKNVETASRCHICGWWYRKSDHSVRDNCHVTGKYRGSAHRDCNIKFGLTKRIPVIFHNLRGYDFHFIMQEIGKLGQEINVIPNNMENYMAFMLGKHLVFIDSFQFK